MDGQGGTCVGVDGRVWMQWCVLNECMGLRLVVVLEQAAIVHVYVCMKIKKNTHTKNCEWWVRVTGAITCVDMLVWVVVVWCGG